MTILICIPCLMTGGTEIQTLNLVQALVAEGYRVVTTCYFEYSDDMVVRFQKAGSGLSEPYRGASEWLAGNTFFIQRITQGIEAV